MSKYKIEPRVYLINKSGEIECNYVSITEAAQYLRPLRHQITIGEHHGEIAWGLWESWRRDKQPYYDYILRDDRGRHLGWDDLNRAWERLHPPRKEKGSTWRRERPGHEVGGERYRREPVAGVWKRNPSRWGTSYRRPAVLREWAETEAALRDEELSDFPGLVRRKRRVLLRELNDWDGPVRNDWRERSWKRHRRTQWKTT